MTARELNAARIADPALREAYTICRRLNARHGKTYFLATRLLPPDRRSSVHALYGFARWADDIVDDLGETATVQERAHALCVWEEELRTGLWTGTSSHPVLHALVHTAALHAIDHQHFIDFMASMTMDLTVSDYATYDDLMTYVHGSAAVIGLQMVPVLGTVVPREEAEPHAAALGIAFQLTNFLRDVGEDLDRGRIYLPADLLSAHGVDRPLLLWSRDTGRDDPRVRAALAEAATLTHRVYREAEPGIAMLEKTSRPCIRAAFTLYRDILHHIARADYPVLHRRVVVPGTRRAAVALGGLCRLAAARTRRGGRTARVSPAPQHTPRSTPASPAPGGSGVTPTGGRTA